MSAPATWRVSNSEIGIAADGATALDAAAAVLQRLGKVKERNADRGLVQGSITYGLQRCKTRVSVRPDERGSILVVQATSDDVRNVGGKSAMQRMTDGLLNLNNPGYVADRRGVSIGALVGGVCAFVIILIVAMSLISKILT